uniref:Uncharacterized protein n=1 Tax=Magallana gigas TaxID=29159 RepID=K1Q7M6_MAGGI
MPTAPSSSQGHIKAHTPKPTTSLPTSSGTETTVETSSVPPNTEPTVTSIVTSIEVNQTETTPEPVKATTTGPSTADCQNNPNIDCRMYNLEVTCDINGKYYPWAKTNCPLYCGYCQVPTMAIKCEDKLPNCDEYLDVCSKHLYLLFREENCRKFCGICNVYAKIAI